jgi:hypothetical protein
MHFHNVGIERRQSTSVINVGCALAASNMRAPLLAVAALALAMSLPCALCSRGTDAQEAVGGVLAIPGRRLFARRLSRDKQGDDCIP